MNYEPNMRLWKPGDLVIHDADAKTQEMLMKIEDVICHKDAEDTYVSVYLYPRKSRCSSCQQYINKWDNTKYCNELKYLHDPARFGINTIFKTINGFGIIPASKITKQE